MLRDLLPTLAFLLVIYSQTEPIIAIDKHPLALLAIATDSTIVPSRFSFSTTKVTFIT